MLPKFVKEGCIEEVILENIATIFGICIEEECFCCTQMMWCFLQITAAYKDIRRVLC